MFDTDWMGSLRKISPDLQEHVRRIAPVVLAAEQILPVHEVFHGLLPGGGLQRGWITQVTGSASARVLAWALLGKVTTSGGWIAAVDVPGISLCAAREVGVAVERVLVIKNPSEKVWSATIGSLIGSVDAIVFASPRHRVQPSEYRRMASRCRERGTVLVELAPGQPSSNAGQRPGQLQYDMGFSVDPLGWDGLGVGFGRVEARSLGVTATGRRAPGGGRRGLFALPAGDGTLQCNG